MPISRLPAMRVGLCDEDLCLFWSPEGAIEESTELHFDLGVDVALDVRWQSSDRQVLVSFFTENQALPSDNPAWDNLRQTLACFWAERQEIEMVAWNPAKEDQGLHQIDCVVSLRSEELGTALMLLTELGQLLRGYLVGTCAL